MEIRRAQAAELPELFRIQLRALELTAMLAGLSAHETPPLIRHGSESGDTFVALVDRQLLGFAVAGVGL